MLRPLSHVALPGDPASGTIDSLLPATSAVRRIYVSQLSGLGDVLLSGFAMAALRDRYPAAHIIFACQATHVGVLRLYAYQPDEVASVDFDQYVQPVVTEALVERTRAALAALHRADISTCS
jgi:hypothetical protein